MSAVLTAKIPLPALAKQWGWSQQRLYRLCKANRIPHVRIGRDIFFEEPALEMWLEQRRRGSARGEAAEASHPDVRSRTEECQALGIEPNHEFS